ncbi:putative peptide synthetase [Podospora fimiseda]|uniref:Peptide synthetase n=1 Tax=Podospora fimiseda TaxID=252190 RepID=A0AAN7BSN3_9PEZI|nr:putative peptide synthetase [Podospora fimiseda]
MESPPAVVDRHAQENPNGIWAKIPLRSDNGDLYWEGIKWSHLSNAVNILVKFMTEHLGLPAHENESLAYTGISDMRYAILILASLKLGYEPLFTSPRNSEEGHLSLLKTTRCGKFLYTKEFTTTVTSLSSQSNPRLFTLEIPPLNYFLFPTDPSNIPPSPTYPTIFQDDFTLLTIHTSGSTGLPKAVPLKSGVIRTATTMSKMPVPPNRSNGHDLFHNKSLAAALPFFHVFGLNLFFVCSIYSSTTTLILLPGDKPPTAEIMLECLVKTKPDAAACTPFIIEEMVLSLPGGFEALCGLGMLLFGGAPLARDIGMKLSSKTKLMNGIGSTEAFFVPCLVLEDLVNDWEYIEFAPGCGINLEPVDGLENKSELVIKRTEEGMEWQQFVFYNFPEVKEWRTRDLFEEHLTKRGLWRYAGRLDDVVVLNNGEKLNPVRFEKILEGGSGKVKGAVVFGTGEFQTGLLIEPTDDIEDEEKFVDEVWELVEVANKEYPAFARVWRSMVLVGKKDKPFVRTPKGSVMRRRTEKVYEEEIRELYCSQVGKANGHSGKVTNGHGSVTANGHGIKDVIRQAVHAVLGSKGEGIEDDTNIFNVGADSLQALQISRTLTATKLDCALKTVYSNPSIDQLAVALSATENTRNRTADTISREERMSRMIYRYSKFVKTPVPVYRSKKIHSGFGVLLVGSTGSLGSYLLQGLLDDERVEVIYCLNRSKHAIERQSQSFRERGLGDVNFEHHPKVRFLTGETSLEHFGLDSMEYDSLQKAVDIIVINAWPVNFNSPLESFESVIAGTKRCADFAAFSPQHPQIVFISSIASVMNWGTVRHDPEDGETIVIPEVWDSDNSIPAKQGYAESKHVAGCILQKAAYGGYIKHPSILRVGQLAGAVGGKGVWNKQEWFPSLVKTSKALGKIPSRIGQDTIDWVPVDVAAQTIIDIAFKRYRLSGFTCFNIVNPHSAEWEELVAVIQQFYSAHGQSLQPVSFDEWLSDLKAVSATATDEEIERMPGLKILDFYESLTGGINVPGYNFETELAVENSPTMANLAAVNGKMMWKWMEEWNF